MMGHTRPAAMIGKPWMDLHAPSDVQEVESEIREGLMRDGKWFGPVTNAGTARLCP